MASDFDALSDLLDDAPGGAIERGAADELLDRSGRFAAIVARLLDKAGRALRSDREAAIACIARASELLQAERDRHRAGGAPTMPARGGLPSWQMRRVAAYVDANLASTIRLNDLARIARLSASHFARAFKASFGASPSAFVARRRVEQAQHLMLTTDAELCQIALSCGFCDQSHFSRLFRHVIGMSPNMWRRQWHGGHRPQPGRAGARTAGDQRNRVPDVVMAKVAAPQWHGPAASRAL